MRIEDVLSSIPFNSKFYLVERSSSSSTLPNTNKWTTKIIYRRTHTLANSTSELSQQDADTKALGQVFRHAAYLFAQSTYTDIKEHLSDTYGKEKWFSSAGVGKYGPQITVVGPDISWVDRANLSAQSESMGFVIVVVDKIETITETSGGEPE